MNRKKLVATIKSRKSFLCVGLDPDLSKIPKHIQRLADPIFAFNQQIIDATRAHCVAYKPNLAFYECLGIKGWEALEKTIAYIGKDHFVIADAKRGDIGNTARKYAEAFFHNLDVDALTVAPYMGSDSVKPFLEFDEKWVVLLALTSNLGASDFQFEVLKSSNKALFEKVIQTSKSWGTAENLMYVIGATRPEYLKKIRESIPAHFFLIPGIGAQGGSLAAVAENSLNSDIGILVNSSRSIIYASNGLDFADAAKSEAKKLSRQMQTILEEKSLI